MPHDQSLTSILRYFKVVLLLIPAGDLSFDLAQLLILDLFDWNQTVLDLYIRLEQEAYRACNCFLCS